LGGRERWLGLSVVHIVKKMNEKESHFNKGSSVRSNSNIQTRALNSP